jgi:hypothetical protein
VLQVLTGAQLTIGDIDKVISSEELSQLVDIAAMGLIV